MPGHCTSEPQHLVPFPAPNYVYWGGDGLYVNLTSRCSAACEFCLRTFTWQIFGYDLLLRPEQEPSAEQVIQAAEAELVSRRAAEIVFTGLGEPTIRLDELLGILAWAEARGAVTRLDTNGHGKLLHPGRQVVSELAHAGLDVASVSLNAPDAATYDRICSPSVNGAFSAVVSFIREAVAAGVRVTATAVMLPGLDVASIRQLALNLGAEFRARPLLTARQGVS